MTAHLAFSTDICKLSGDITFNNIDALFADSLEHLNEMQNVKFDFQAIQNSNSACLALILEWVKFATAHKKQFVFTNLSSQLLKLAAVSGVTNLISE